MGDTDGDRIGLVLSGGGARGAYEAGVVSVLAPTLERRGERLSIVVGTSVGAINAAYIAASLHLGAVRALAQGLARWRQATKRKVIAEPSDVHGRHDCEPPYRRVPYIFVAPERPGAIGELAIEVFHRRYAGLKGLRSLDIPLLGQRDAWRALKSAPEERGWIIEPLPAFTRTAA